MAFELSTTIPSPQIVVHTDLVVAVAAVQDQPVSFVQVELHPSKLRVLLSSHYSPASAIPFPQVAVQTDAVVKGVVQT